MSAAAICARLADIAQTQLGVREHGHNTGGDVLEYQRATWLACGPWPWCAAFAAWVLREWLCGSDARAALHLNSGDSVERWRCRDARAYGWEEWARRQGLLILPETARAQRGDFVTFDFSHIGIVTADNGPTINTIEGNTNGTGSREGDGVYAKTRARPLVRSFIRVLS